MNMKWKCEDIPRSVRHRTSSDARRGGVAGGLSGFTLIELILVIALIAILAGALVPIVRTSRVEAQQAKARSDLDAIKSACTLYHTDTSAWPAAGTTGAGLVATDSVANWNGPYVDEWRADPWGNPYRLINGTATPVTLSVSTLGSDNVAGGTGAATDLIILVTPDRSR